MVEITIEPLLERLKKMIADPDSFTHFNSPADPLKISGFEEQFHVKLPDSYKKFLRKYNGGTILYFYREEFLQNQNIEDYKGVSTCLLSIEEISNRYSFLKDRNWKMNGNFQPYPVIPFCSCPNNEILVFVNGKKSGNESPVFDAFHEDFPRDWGIITSDFVSFLKNYLDESGHPKTIGNSEAGVAADYFDEQTETPQEILARTEAALSKEPEHAFYYCERASAFQKTNQLSEAFISISEAIALAPEDAYFYFIRGEILKDAEKYRQALIDYDTAVKLEPNDTLYLCCRAQILYGFGKLQKALDDCNKAIELDNKYKLAYMMRSEIYLDLGETEKATADEATVNRLDDEAG